MFLAYFIPIFVGLGLIALVTGIIISNSNHLKERKQDFFECIEKTQDIQWCYDKFN